MMKIRSSVWLQKQQLWVMAIGALFVADFVFCGYWPTQHRLTSLKQKRVGYEQTIEIGRAKGAQLAAVRQRLTAAEETVRRYDAHVPAESSLGTFVRQASDLMTQHQLADQAVTNSKETPAGDLVCIPVRISGTGELKNVHGFFKDLRSLDRVVRIDRVSLKNDNGFSGRVTMNAEVIIYYRPGKSPADGRTAGTQAAGGASHGA
jgi:Tfp pilus assembly protein PilO